MEIALLTDLHFGARNDNQKVAAFQKKFYDEVFFPYVDEHGITEVVNLGDTFDRRKFISYTSLKSAKEMLFEPLHQRGMKMYTIVGNHDITYKNTLEVNSINLLLDRYDNVVEYSEPAEINIDGLDILLVPWICKDNEDKTWSMIQQTKAQVCFGHLELTGFQMYKGMPNYEGCNPKAFEKFDQVYSGHFHHKSTSGNVTYLGTAYELTWSCYEDQKGFHIYNTETRELTFIPNEHTMFHKVFYNDSKMTYEDVNNANYEALRDCYVKLVINEKNNPVLFDQLISEIEDVNPIHLQVVEDHMYLDLEDDENIVDEAEDTLSILDGYIEGLDIKHNKKELKHLMHNLYNEALAVE